MIRVMVAAEGELIRAALAALLRQEPDLEVVAQAAGWDGLIGTARRAGPQVAVLGLDLGTDGGIGTAIGLCRHGVRPLVLAGRHHYGAIARVVAEAREVGFLRVDASADLLVRAVHELARGEPVIDPEIAVAVLVAPESPLTCREREILCLAADGSPADEIAVRLGLSVGTVRNHLTRINDKTGARTRIEAVRRATAAGWL